MERDVDSFLEQVRSSEKLLQELQTQLQDVNAEIAQSQTEVARRRQETQKALEEAHQVESELIKLSSSAMVQDVRLNKAEEYRTQIQQEFQQAEKDLVVTKQQLTEERDGLCSEVEKHILIYGLNGNYFPKKKEDDVSAVKHVRSQCDQITDKITELRTHQKILDQEINELTAIEGEAQALQQRLAEPLEHRARVCKLQRQLMQMEQERREGKHLQQLRQEIADAEEETACLRSAAAAMTSELQKMEQLLWFSRMEKMKQKMKCRAETIGDVPRSGLASKPVSERIVSGGRLGTNSRSVIGGNDGFLGLTVLNEAHTPVGRSSTSQRCTSSAGNTPYSTGMSSRARQQTTLDQFCNSSTADHDSLDLAGPSQNGPTTASVSPAAKKTGACGEESRAATDAAASDGGEGKDVDATMTPAAAVPSAPSASEAPGMSKEAHMAQRRWMAHQARMMARRQAATAPRAATSPAQRPPAQPPAPEPQSAPPLASVQPLPRPVPRAAAAAAPSAPRAWGAAATPFCKGPRLTYRGPQPPKRAPTSGPGEFRSALQQYQQVYGGAAPAAPLGKVATGGRSKRVRFSAGADDDDLAGVYADEFCNDDLDDFE